MSDEIAIGTLASISLVFAHPPTQGSAETISRILDAQLRSQCAGSTLVSYRVDLDRIPAPLEGGCGLSSESPESSMELCEDSVDPVDVVVRDGHLHLMFSGADWADLGVPGAHDNVEHAHTIARTLQAHQLMKGAIRDVMHHLAELQGGQPPRRSTQQILQYLGQVLIRSKRQSQFPLTTSVGAVANDRA